MKYFQVYKTNSRHFKKQFYYITSKVALELSFPRIVDCGEVKCLMSLYVKGCTYLPINPKTTLAFL